MNTNKILSVIFGIIVTGIAFLPVARADDFNQETKMTFSQAVEIPGQVLPAGTYWFVLADSDSNRDTVRIFSADRKMLYATIITVNSERREPADATTLKFAERETSGDQALLTWFYPGETVGHEFLYSRPIEKELAQDRQQTVVAQPMAAAEASLGF